MPVAAKQLLAMPVLVTAISGTLALPEHRADAVPPAPAPASVVQKVAPVTKLKRKPIPLAARWVPPMSGYRLTARFGASGLWSSSHTGIDLAAPTGTPIRSVTSGVVVSASWDGAYGQKTVIRTSDGTELWYCHQTSLHVSAGQRVMPGEVIGTVGSTGNVTGPHLHLEVRPGVDHPVDPYAALAAHGIRL